MKERLLLIILFVLLNIVPVAAQHFYPTKFESCNTKLFALESDSIDAHIAEKKMIGFIKENFQQDELKSIIGFLKIQIIAYTDKSSCLLSYENITNRTDEQLHIEQFKESIDQSLIWDQVDETCSPLIRIRFRKGDISITRYGFNGNKGSHELHE